MDIFISLIHIYEMIKYGKSYNKNCSLRNARIGSHKNIRRILKRVIHVQASFNNIIVTVPDVRGRVVSWDSVVTCGFKGARRGTSFAAQTAARNAVHTGMRRAKVMINGPGLGRDANYEPLIEVVVMIHQPASSFYEAQTGEFIVEVKELLKQRETLIRVYVQRTGKPSWVVSKDMERDVFMLATKAKAYEIIDLVVVK
ncbi:hypothetical protein RJ639_026680 [Escallonia herrerae]|uniref:Uncharacterized protein n=1 Tax=Escallonia herrerae TaxID=1293975 RepID=A0AA88X495_9ASTE|nr:hypothetical protein RJ639_026680 [Escallonia herrerae]